MAGQAVVCFVSRNQTEVSVFFGCANRILFRLVTPMATPVILPVSNFLIPQPLFLYASITYLPQTFFPFLSEHIKEDTLSFSTWLIFPFTSIV